MMHPKYFAESTDEGNRLFLKTDREQTKAQLLRNSIQQVPQHAILVDAGAGIGVVSEVMYETVAERAPRHIVLLDSSHDRLSQAKERMDQEPNGDTFVHLCCSLESIPIADNKTDFIFCRFVFEYLTEPGIVFTELIRTLRPGGRVVISDLDLQGLCNYPFPKEIEEVLSETLSLLEKNRLFDPNVGRKLYSMFRESDIRDIQIEVTAHNVLWGKLSTIQEMNWRKKIDYLIEGARQLGLSTKYDLEHFRKLFLDYILREDRFSYTPLVTVQGVKN